MISIETIEKRLTLKEDERNLFTKLKNNFIVSDKLCIINNKSYKIIIKYDDKSTGHLLGDLDKSLIYTFKESNKILYRTNSKKRMINYIYRYVNK